MSVEGIQITTEELRKTSADLQTKKEKMSSIFESIDSKMIRVSQEWEATSAEVYAQQYRGLRNKYEDFKKAINDYAIFLEKTAAIYEDVDKKASNRAGELQSEYNG